MLWGGGEGRTCSPEPQFLTLHLLLSGDGMLVPTFTGTLTFKLVFIKLNRWLIFAKMPHSYPRDICVLRTVRILSKDVQFR